MFVVAVDSKEEEDSKIDDDKEEDRQNASGRQHGQFMSKDTETKNCLVITSLP